MTQVIASYRCPRERGERESRRLVLYQESPNSFVMRGGKWGFHGLITSDQERVIAHWTGYVEANRGRKVRLPRPRFQEGK